jgi:hypothetical protein
MWTGNESAMAKEEKSCPYACDQAKPCLRASSCLLAAICPLLRCGALNDLHVNLGDKPQDDESAMADDLETAVFDLIGTLHDARRAAQNAQKSLRHPPDLDHARRALTLCQNRFHRFEKPFACDLVSYEKLKELARLGNERRAWLPWVSTAVAWWFTFTAARATGIAM